MSALPCEASLRHLQEELALSDGQVQDLMFLRRVYFLRRHELQQQRATLHAKAQEHDSEPMFASGRTLSVSRQLHRNSVEDLQTMLRFSWTMYLGVSGPLIALQTSFCMPVVRRPQIRLQAICAASLINKRYASCSLCTPAYVLTMLAQQSTARLCHL